MARRAGCACVVTDSHRCPPESLAPICVMLLVLLEASLLLGPAAASSQPLLLGHCPDSDDHFSKPHMLPHFEYCRPNLSPANRLRPGPKLFGSKRAATWPFIPFARRVLWVPCSRIFISPYANSGSLRALPSRRYSPWPWALAPIQPSSAWSIRFCSSRFP